MQKFMSHPQHNLSPALYNSGMTGRRLISWGVLVFVFGVFLIPYHASLIPRAHAASISTAPVIIDGHGKPREILRYTVTLVNDTSYMKPVYPWVSTVDPKKGELSAGEAEEKSRGEALGKWIEISHAGQFVKAGESIELPVLIQIDVAAKPGVYHAALNFSVGADRASAQGSDDTVSVFVNITVDDDANERLQLGEFAPERNFFGGDKASFALRIENIGNRGVVPKGKIHIYDRKGEEVATIDANAQGEKVEPSAALNLAGVWAAGGEFGRYKAFLDVEYGERGTLQDTAFFWVMPWTKLFGMFAGLCVAAVILALVFHSRGLSRRGYAPAYAEAVESGAREKEVESSFSGSESRVRNFVDRFRGQFLGGDDEVTAFSPPVPPLRTADYGLRTREIHIPPPVSVYQGPPVRLGQTKTVSAPETHKVTLHKKERPAPPPEHVVNLKTSY